MPNDALSIVYRPLGDLTPHPHNPRQHPATQKAQIAESIERYGWTVPIIVDENNTILAGHGRYAVAQAMEGLDEVPTVTVSGLSEEQKRAYVLTDNKVAENALWDAEAVLREIEFLTGHGIEAEHMGFDDEDMLGLHSLCGVPEFDDPGVTIESETEPTLMQGDGQPSLADQRLDPANEPGDTQDAEDHTNAPAGDAESDVDFDSPPDGKVLLNIPLMSFQRERVMEVIEMIKEDEDVTSDTDALFLMAELYAERRDDG